MAIKLVFGSVAIASMLALSVLPAIAAPPSISFGLQFGNAPAPPLSGPLHFDNGDNQDSCISTKSIFRRLSHQGYSNLDMTDQNDQGLVIDARFNHHWYELIVDDCNGDIVDRTRISHD
jgi:hypothetical protein